MTFSHHGNKAEILSSDMDKYKHPLLGVVKLHIHSKISTVQPLEFEMDK